MKKEILRQTWLKLGVLAVLICIIVVVIFKSTSNQEEGIPPLNIIEYNGAYYESVDMRRVKILDKYNLPRKITEDMIGICLGTVQDINDEKSEQTLYQYKPYSHIYTSRYITAEYSEKHPQRAVYVIEDNGEFSFALFCNFISFDSNTHTEAREMFAIYGIDEANDIESITLGKKKISDPDKIKSFFDNLYNSYAMGNDDYQGKIYGGLSEEEQQALSIELAESSMEISILTKEGIVINYITYSPKINYIDWALNYYKLSDSIE